MFPFKIALITNLIVYFLIFIFTIVYELQNIAFWGLIMNNLVLENNFWFQKNFLK